MQRHLTEVEARGAQLVAVAQGTAAEADRFCHGLGVTYPCVGDRERASYGAFALPRGGWKEILVDPLFSRDGLKRLGGASIRGSLAPHSDWFQLPGVAIVDRAGTVRWLHRSRHSADIPPAAAVLAALDAVVA